MYWEFQRGMTGGFFTSLFHSIAKAKNENVYKLAMGFPGEVYAYQEYIGSLDPYAWDIEGETTGEKFGRLTEKREIETDPDLELRTLLQDKEFHIDGKPLSDKDLAVFNFFLDTIKSGLKNNKL